MANTIDLKSVEPLARQWLGAKYRKVMEEDEMALDLPTGGQHRFDVVSKDRKLVAGVKTHRIRANGGVGQGVMKSLYAEIYFLHLVDAETKLLVLTDPDLFQLFVRRSRGKISPDVEVVLFELPNELVQRLAIVHQAASGEIGKRNPLI